MIRNSNVQQTKKTETSMAKMFKSPTSIISILIVTTIIVVSFYTTSISSLSAQAPKLMDPKPKQFDLAVAYSYVGQGPQNDTFTDSYGTVLSPVSQYPSAVYFNITRPNIEKVTCDAVLEVYEVIIASDKGPTEKFVYFAGTNYNPSFSGTEYNSLTQGIYDLFDLSAVDAITGDFRFNWTDNESALSAKVGSYGIYTNYVNGLGLWSKGKPNTISVNIFRIGYVTMTNGDISVQPDTQGLNNKTQVQLQEYNDGFLKNEMPMDALSQNNKFEPLK